MTVAVHQSACHAFFCVFRVPKGVEDHLWKILLNI